MEIQLENVGKKFNKEWVFENINITLSQHDAIGISGPNGSGKSTLLQIIAGSILQSKGKLIYKIDEKPVEPEQIYKYLSLVAPAMSLPEDFTLEEFITFHFKFKKLKEGYSNCDLPDLFKLYNSKNKIIKNFSTGMKQRLKLGIAFYSDSPLMLLDEPSSNLDSNGLDWYLKEIDKVLKEKLIFVCSNRKEENNFCDKFIDILDYKN